MKCQEVKQKKAVIEGPKGVGSRDKGYSTKGGQGMRQTYKQTGKPGKGSR